MLEDICDKELGALRKARWAKAFSDEPIDSAPDVDMDRKATIVIEHLIQARYVAIEGTVDTIFFAGLHSRLFHCFVFLCDKVMFPIQCSTGRFTCIGMSVSSLNSTAHTKPGEPKRIQRKAGTRGKLVRFLDARKH